MPQTSSRRRSLANLGLGLLGAVLGNSGGAGAAQIAAGLLANGVFLKFSRDDEREADRVGLQLLRRAGWDGRGMVELFEILRRESARDPGSVEIFFSSHPSPQDRIERLQADVERAPGARATASSSNDQGAAAALPAPRSMPTRIIDAKPPRRRTESRICSSTRTTPLTGTRGATRRSRRRAAKTSRSSCRSATRPATGAT